MRRSASGNDVAGITFMLCDCPSPVRKASVTTDPSAGYFGAKLDDKALTTADNARLGAIRFDDWLRSSLKK